MYGFGIFSVLLESPQMVPRTTELPELYEQEAIPTEAERMTPRPGRERTRTTGSGNVRWTAPKEGPSPCAACSWPVSQAGRARDRW